MSVRANCLLGVKITRFLPKQNAGAFEIALIHSQVAGPCQVRRKLSRSKLFASCKITDFLLKVPGSACMHFPCQRRRSGRQSASKLSRKLLLTVFSPPRNLIAHAPLTFCHMLFSRGSVSQCRQTNKNVLRSAGFEPALPSGIGMFLQRLRPLGHDRFDTCTTKCMRKTLPVALYFSDVILFFPVPALDFLAMLFCLRDDNRSSQTFAAGRMRIPIDKIFSLRN